MATIRIEVSDETLAAIERERAARGETQGSKQIYVSDETDEIALSVALARYAFEANPWDDGGDSAASTANQ